MREQGSVLDNTFLDSISKFDIIYSWEIPYHTEDMWKAMHNISSMVKPEGIVYIAFYNHQIYWSSFHTILKRTYNTCPIWCKWVMIMIFAFF